MVSRDAFDALAFEPELMKYLRISSTETSDLLTARLTYRELVGHVISSAPGPIFVEFVWRADGEAYLAVEDLGPVKLRGAAALAPHVRPGLRLCRPTLIGTRAEAILPLERRCPDLSMEVDRPSPPFAIFRRMEIGRWIERHAGELGAEARGDLTAEGAPLPPHDATAPGRSEVQIVAEIGRAIYFNTVPLWLRDVRWLAQVAAARGVPVWRLQREFHVIFRVIGMRLPVPDTGILARMRDAVADGFTNVSEESAVADGSPAADFLASFGTPDGPAAEYARLRAQGWTEADIFSDVLTPVQIENGRQWQLGRLSAAEGQRRTSIVRDLIARSREGAPNSAPDGFCVVASCAPRERHDVGLEMVTTLLRVRGVRVEYLGSSVLPEEIMLAAITHQARAVVLSATTSAGVYELIELVGRLKRDARTSHVQVALGGAPFNELPQLCAVVGGDAVLFDARQAVRFCEKVREQTQSLGA